MTHPLGYIKFPTDTGFVPQELSDCFCVYSLTTWGKICLFKALPGVPCTIQIFPFKSNTLSNQWIAKLAPWENAELQQ